jgi:hypothetical protein
LPRSDPQHSWQHIIISRLDWTPMVFLSSTWYVCAAQVPPHSLAYKSEKLPWFWWHSSLVLLTWQTSSRRGMWWKAMQIPRSRRRLGLRPMASIATSASSSNRFHSDSFQSLLSSSLSSLSSSSSSSSSSIAADSVRRKARSKARYRCPCGISTLGSSQMHTPWGILLQDWSSLWT